MAAVALLLAGCGLGTSQAQPERAPRPSGPASPAGVTETTQFTSVVDGDTVKTSAGTVRLIGIDTPERGECGHDEASAELGRLVSRGDAITLELPSGQNDRDRHGRLLRYVITADGLDLARVQLEAGHAVARYDGTDGYPAHPRQSAYHAAQVASQAPGGGVLTLTCAGAAPHGTSLEGPWWQQYTSCGRLKRNTVGHPTGPFSRDDPAEAEIYAWFAHGTGNNGDGDGDGLACE